MTDKLITPSMLIEISGPLFMEVFAYCVADDSFIKEFNKLNKSNISFSNSPPRTAIEAMVDKATNYKGFVSPPQLIMERLVYTIYRTVYLPFLKEAS